MAELARKLSLFDAVSIVVGIVIGGGIFLVPSVIARNLPTAGSILLVWLAAAILSFFGALAFAELGAMLPATGGQYVFLREAYGPLIAFLCAWTLFLIIMAAQISSLAIGFAIYLSQFVSLAPWASKAVALALIAVISLVSYRGTKAGAFVQKTFLVLKVAGILVLIGSAFFSHAPSRLDFSSLGPVHSTQLGFAMVACLLAYDGWNIVSFISGEIKRPERNIPLALGFGVATVAVLYLLLNLAFLKVLTVPEIAAADKVGAVVAGRTLGPIGASVVAVVILISIVGSLNGGVMAPPRIYFAQARDGLFFRSFGVVHPRFLTPGLSIIAQGVWASILAVTGNYERLISFAILASWIFYALTVVGLIVLRRKRPDLARPYRMWGYPFTAVAFVAISVWFVITTVMHSPGSSAVALLLIGSGVPVYWIWRKRNA